jgi:hypothetical protein
VLLGTVILIDTESVELRYVMSNGSSNVLSVEGKMFSEIKNSCPLVVWRMMYISSVFMAKDATCKLKNSIAKIIFFIETLKK